MFKNYRKFSIKYFGIDPQAKLDSQNGGKEILEQEEVKLEKDSNLDGGSLSQTMEEAKEEKVTRARLKKAVELVNEASFKMPEEQWETDIKEQLCSHGEKHLIVRFQNDSQAGLKTEALQLARFFLEEMEGIDPFYIQGQDWNQVTKDNEQGNYLNNFVDLGKYDDLEDIQLLDVLPGKS